MGRRVRHRLSARPSAGFGEAIHWGLQPTVRPRTCAAATEPEVVSQLVAGLSKDAKFKAAARTEDIQQAEERLGLALPDDLKSLLLETDGVTGNYSSPLVWSAEELVRQNLLFRGEPDFRDLYMPFDHLLFFGAEANADQFAYRILNGRVQPTSWIYEWDHESDNREWFAHGLKDYLERCVPKD